MGTLGAHELRKAGLQDWVVYSLSLGPEDRLCLLHGGMGSRLSCARVGRTLGASGMMPPHQARTALHTSSEAGRLSASLGSPILVDTGWLSQHGQDAYLVSKHGAAAGAGPLPSSSCLSSKNVLCKGQPGPAT